MAGHRAHRGRRVDVGEEDGQPDRLTPDSVPRPGGQAPDPFERVLHAARERHPEDGRQQEAEKTGGAQDLGRCGKELYHRAGRGVGQAHAVDHPYGYTAMGGGARGGDDDEQREHGEHGQGGETHGPFHELKFLAAAMEVVEPQVAPDPPGAPEHRVVHRPVRDLAQLPLNSPIGPLLHHATPRLDSALSRESRGPGTPIFPGSRSSIPRRPEIACAFPGRIPGTGPGPAVRCGLLG